MITEAYRGERTRYWGRELEIEGQESIQGENDQCIFNMQSSVDSRLEVLISFVIT